MQVGHEPAPVRVGAICSSRRTSELAFRRLEKSGLFWRGMADADTDSVCSMAAECDVLLFDLDDDEAARAAPLVCARASQGLRIVDLGMRSQVAFIAVASAARRAGQSMFGATWQTREVGKPSRLVVDDAALVDPQTVTVLHVLADEVRSCGAAGASKAMAALAALMAGAIGLVNAEALSLGASAGLEHKALVSLLRQGSGWNTLLSDQSAGGPTLRDGLEGLSRGQALATATGHSAWFAAVGCAVARSILSESPDPVAIVPAATVWFDRHSGAR